MRILVLPDSFKGSLSAIDFCGIAKRVIENNLGASVECYPICDGGEGSVDCLNTIFNGKTFTSKVTDGNLFKRTAKFGYDDKHAFIAVSETSGLPQTMIKDPGITTTVGMGEQILQAKHLGKKDIVLCLGGSSTNDGGAGLVYALGGRFYDKDGNSFLPTGDTLGNVVSIDLKDFNKAIEGMTFTALSDVTNPLLGPNGCSYVFSPQKGAKTQAQVDRLEYNMAQYATVTGFLGAEPSSPGAGAAGGLGYCVLAFLKGKIVSGIDFILNAIEFEKKVAAADIIITGEGKFDTTSLSGKVVSGIINRTPKDKRIFVLCGQGDPNDKVTVVPINDHNLSLSENMMNTKTNLENALRELCQIL